MKFFPARLDFSSEQRFYAVFEFSDPQFPNDSSSITSLPRDTN